MDSSNSLLFRRPGLGSCEARDLSGQLFRESEFVGDLFADPLLRLVTVKTPRAFIPEPDFPVEVLADDGIRGGGLENVADEVKRLLGVRYEGVVKEICSHSDGCNHEAIKDSAQHLIEL